MTNSSEWESPPGLPSSEDRNWAMAAHLAPALLSMASGGIAGVVVTVVIYLVKKDESAFVAGAAKEALNFQISVFIAAIAGVILVLTGILACIGLPILLVLGLAELILGIIAGVQASKGIQYRYPVCLRLIQ